MINPILFLLCHFVGDFWLQSSWMATNKYDHTKTGYLACLVHVLIYTACFLVLTTSWKALLLIGISHFIIDKFPIIVKRLIWWKNHFPLGKYPPFKECDVTGYYDDSLYTTEVKERKFAGIKVPKWYPKKVPFCITIWLYIVSDNTLHLIFNYVALTLL